MAIRRILVFVVMASVGIAVGRLTPLRSFFEVETIEALSRQFGVWGPVLLILIGSVSPFLFLPRWPTCFAAGLLYGLVWGTAIAAIASVLGAWFHFSFAKILVSASADRLLRRFRLTSSTLSSGKSFWIVFLLRVFPLSNSAATNVLAGSLNLSTPAFLTATFVGMIPSTVLYTTWGTLMKTPEPRFYAIAVAILVLMVAGTSIAARFLFPGSTTDPPGTPPEPRDRR